MGKVIITDIEKGDALTASSLNETIDSWNFYSTNIDDENIREEGIDRRNIADVSVTQNPSETAGTSATDGTSRNLLHAGASDPISHYQIGPFSYDSTDQVGMKVTCSFEFETEEFGSSTHTTTVTPTYHFQIAYSTNGTSWSGITQTKRTVGPGVDTFPAKGDMTISHVFDTITGSASTLYFGLQQWEDSANHSVPPGAVVVDNFNMFAVRILR